MSGTIEFDKKCIPTSEYVVLRIINRNDKFNAGGIMLPSTAYSNDRLAFGKIEEVGKKAFEEYGVKKDDYVVFDRLATAYQTEPVAVIKYVNIIAKTNEENTTFSPLKNMVFVQDESDTTQNVGGILVNNYNKQLRIGKVVAINLDPEIEKDIPYKKGDTVMLSKGGDSFQVGDQHVFIYKHDMVVCKVEEKESK